MVNWSHRVVIILGSVFGLIGIGLLWGSWISYNSTKEFLAQAVTTEGTVIDLKEVGIDGDDLDDLKDDGEVYYPVVQYQASNGDKYKFVGSTGTNPPSYQVGEKISVIYQPSSPEEATINTVESLWFGAIFFLIMGVIFSGVGGGCLWLLLKLRKIDEENYLDRETPILTSQQERWLEMPPFPDSWTTEDLDFEEVSEPITGEYELEPDI